MGAKSRFMAWIRNKGTLSVDEVGAVLDESPRYVRRVTENGYLHPVSVNPYRYSAEEVAEYAQEQARRRRRLAELIASGEDLYSDE